MGNVIVDILRIFAGTLRDVAPIVIILAFFQVGVLRRPIPHLKQALIGSCYVVVGLALFLVGLEEALFPLGETMARQLTDPVFVYGEAGAPLSGEIDWRRYYWIYLFAAAIGFATTIAEPSLIAVSLKASEASGGAVKPWALRIAVAIGVAASISLGAFRIVTGTPLHYYMMAGYLIVIVQTLFAPKEIIPLAYDSGGVTTSTVTVPLVTALGLGLASTVPGRSPLLDGFGLIALASLFPMITVMGYAQGSVAWTRWFKRRQATKTKESVDESAINGDNAPNNNAPNENKSNGNASNTVNRQPDETRSDQGSRNKE